MSLPIEAIAYHLRDKLTPQEFKTAIHVLDTILAAADALGTWAVTNDDNNASSADR